MDVNKLENFYDIPIETEFLHNTFLLSSSVNSIRFWSLDCPIHHSNPLMINSTRHAYRQQYGISGMSLYRSTKNIHLIWFDVPSYQLYHGTIIRPMNKKDCNSLLRLENIQPLQFDSNPYSDNPNGDNFFHLTIDTKNQLLFLSNLLQNRIDIYEINDESLIENKIQWRKSFNQTNHPKNIQADSKLKILFWIESWKRICRMDYSDLQNNNLIKNCTDDFFKHQPITMTLDSENHRLIWSDKSNHILSGDYWIRNEMEAISIYNSSISSVIDLTIFSNRDIRNGQNDHHKQQKQWIFVQDQHEIQLIDLSTNNETIVLIESQTIFESLLLTFRDNEDNHQNNNNVVDVNRHSTKHPIISDEQDEHQRKQQQQEQIIRIDNNWFYFFITIFIIIIILIVISIIFTCFTIYNRSNNNNDNNINDNDSIESTFPANRLSNPGYRKLDRISDDRISDLSDNSFTQQQQQQQQPYSTSLNNKPNKMKTKLITNDIEDIVVVPINITSRDSKDYNNKKSSSLSFINPFILVNNCDTCLIPEQCQGQGICLATYGSRNKNICK
uniref:Cytochrome c oxidase polypeptide II n=1 Tax=Dermatophagoides pteronyssinus TaxID=6956 RepID=A0A6P6YAS4_DERPT|nr:probable serine/threonine-protein kinase DDB_G0283337 [Dermatophagoides pteronyssinus]